MVLGVEVGGRFSAETKARAVASSSLELPRASSADGETPPSHEVERDLHVAGRLL